MIQLYGGGFAVAFVQASLTYFTISIVLHYVVPVVFTVHSVQKGERREDQVLKEALQSIPPLAVKSAIWTICENMHKKGISLLYSGPIDSPKHIAYAVFCIVALDYLHDAWFYWTHRLLHWKPLYRHVHLMHHKSVVPTPFTGYSFHVIEAVIVFANEILVCFLFPIHMGLHRMYHILSSVIHNGGHAGYEMAPFIPSIEGLVALLFNGGKRPSPALNTVMHHDMHHRFPNGHFSLYMTHWDRWMGTEHVGYQESVNRHFTAVHAAQSAVQQ